MNQIFEIPLFPLGSVLFPGGFLPLHIFETRYQQLLNKALETDRRFGVVLISRGSEVGGGETRTDVGTIAYIDDYQRFDDGRAAVSSRGTTRFQVVRWLEDDPYPRAMVQEIVDGHEGPNDRDLLSAARKTFASLIDLGQRLGRLESVPRAAFWTSTAFWQRPHEASALTASTYCYTRSMPTWNSWVGSTVLRNDCHFIVLRSMVVYRPTAPLHFGHAGAGHG